MKSNNNLHNELDASVANEANGTIGAKRRTGRNANPALAERKKLNTLLASRAANDKNIERLKNEIATIKDANKKIDIAISATKKEISASLFKATDTDDFTKIVDALADANVNPIDVLKLVLKKDFEKLEELITN